MDRGRRRRHNPGRVPIAAGAPAAGRPARPRRAARQASGPAVRIELRRRAGPGTATTSQERHDQLPAGERAEDDPDAADRPEPEHAGRGHRRRPARRAPHPPPQLRGGQARSFRGGSISPGASRRIRSRSRFRRAGTPTAGRRVDPPDRPHAVAVQLPVPAGRPCGQEVVVEHACRADTRLLGRSPAGFQIAAKHPEQVHAVDRAADPVHEGPHVPQQDVVDDHRILRRRRRPRLGCSRRQQHVARRGRLPREPARLRSAAPVRMDGRDQAPVGADDLLAAGIRRDAEKTLRLFAVHRWRSHRRLPPYRAARPR